MKFILVWFDLVWNIRDFFEEMMIKLIVEDELVIKEKWKRDREGCGC